MLVLSRKIQQEIVIGDTIRISVLQVKGNTVRLGIEAPRAVRVVRGELNRLDREGDETDPGCSQGGAGGATGVSRENLDRGAAELIRESADFYSVSPPADCCPAALQSAGLSSLVEDQSAVDWEQRENQSEFVLSFQTTPSQPVQLHVEPVAKSTPSALRNSGLGKGHSFSGVIMPGKNPVAECQEVARRVPSSRSGIERNVAKGNLPNSPAPRLPSPNNKNEALKNEALRIVRDEESGPSSPEATAVATRNRVLDILLKLQRNSSGG